MFVGFNGDKPADLAELSAIEEAEIDEGIRGVYDSGGYLVGIEFTNTVLTLGQRADLLPVYDSQVFGRVANGRYRG